MVQESAETQLTQLTQLTNFCPHCGRDACAVEREVDRHGETVQVLRCDACRRESLARPHVGFSSHVVYQTVRCRCPLCQSPNPAVTSTIGTIRKHRCGKCGLTFKSVEKS